MNYQEQKDIERAIRLSLLEEQHRLTTTTTDSLTKRQRPQSPFSASGTKKRKLTLLDSLPKKPNKKPRPFGGNSTKFTSSDEGTSCETLTTPTDNSGKFKTVFKNKSKRIATNTKTETHSTSKSDEYKISQQKVLPAISSSNKNETQYVKPHLRPSSAYVPPPPKELISSLQHFDFIESLFSDEDSSHSTSDTEFKKRNSKKILTTVKRKNNEIGSPEYSKNVAIKSASLHKIKDLSAKRSSASTNPKKSNKRKTQPVLLDSPSSSSSSLPSLVSSTKGKKGKEKKKHVKSVSKKVIIKTGKDSKIKKPRVAIKTACKKLPPSLAGEGEKDTKLPSDVPPVVIDKSPIRSVFPHQH